MPSKEKPEHKTEDYRMGASDIEAVMRRALDVPPPQDKKRKRAKKSRKDRTRK